MVAGLLGLNSVCFMFFGENEPALERFNKRIITDKFVGGFTQKTLKTDLKMRLYYLLAC